MGRGAKSVVVLEEVAVILGLSLFSRRGSTERDAGDRTMQPIQTWRRGRGQGTHAGERNRVRTAVRCTNDASEKTKRTGVSEAKLSMNEVQARQKHHNIRPPEIDPNGPTNEGMNDGWFE